MRNPLTVAFLLLGMFAAPDVAHSQATLNAEGVADKMLAAIGGRMAWAGIKNTINDSQQNRLDEPTVVRAIIAMDFTSPRFRIETTAPDLRVVRVIDDARSWRLTRQGTIDSVPAAIVREDMQWYAGHVYRTLHRIAARDGALRLAMGAGGRLEVFEGQSRIAWFNVDARGEPYAFGAHNDDVGSISGPWDFIRDGISHPLWVSRPDGSWRANITALRVNAQLPDSLSVRPAPDGQRSAASTWPPARNSHLLVAAPDHGVLLFGGAADNTARLVDTLWRWSGSSWSPSSDAGPRSRNLPAAAFDSRRGVVVLYGGSGAVTTGSRIIPSSWRV